MEREPLVRGCDPRLEARQRLLRHAIVGELGEDALSRLEDAFRQRQLVRPAGAPEPERSDRAAARSRHAGAVNASSHPMSLHWIDPSALTGTHEPPQHRCVFGRTEDFQAFPHVHRLQIWFLDPASSRAATAAFGWRDVFRQDYGFGTDPFGAGFYRRVEKIWNDPPETLKKGLFQRGVPFAERVFIFPVFGGNDDPVVMTTWKIVTKYGDSLFGPGSPNDNLVVLGESASWCLHYHHDGDLTFADQPDYSKLPRPP